VALFLGTGILFVFALGFALFACYHLMIDSWGWEPWQAGLLIAGGLAIPVVGLLVQLFRPPQQQTIVIEEPVSQPSTEPPENNDTESGLKLGEEVGRSLQRHYRENSLDLIVAAMVLGVVTGARQGRRGRRPCRSKKGSHPKRNKSEP
jgi:hypothetical protein